MAGNELTDKAGEELEKLLLDSVSRLAKLDLKLCNIGAKVTCNSEILTI